MPYADKFKKQEHDKIYRETHREELKAHYLQNRAFHLQRCKEYRLKTKLQIFAHYCGGEDKIRCQCPCGCYVREISCLSIQHLNGNGKIHRTTLRLNGAPFYRWVVKNNYPSDLAVWCMNCQMIDAIKGSCKGWI